MEMGGGLEAKWDWLVHVGCVVHMRIEPTQGQTAAYPT